MALTGTIKLVFDGTRPCEPPKAKDKAEEKE
jgi:hypothetical protein